jgi:cytochrome P450
MTARLESPTILPAHNRAERPSNRRSQTARLDRTVPPGPRGHLLLGSLPDYVEDRLGFVTELHAQYGPVAQYTVGGTRVISVASPAGAQHVLQKNNHNYTKETKPYAAVRWITGNGLFTNEGESWLSQRRLMQPAFHRQRIAAFCDLMSRHATALADSLEPAAASGATVDMAHEMTRLTLEIVVQALFSTDLGEHEEPLILAMAQLLEYVSFRFQHPFYPDTRVPTPRNLRYSHALATVDSCVHSVIEQRRRSMAEGASYNDLLEMLMSARDAETGAGMSDKQLRDEVVTLFIAGHETTAGMLTWAWYLLSKHPDVARRLRAELDTQLAGRAPGMADVPTLTYTRQVLDETLRLYPPIWTTNRLALEDDEIDGFHIPAGSVVALVPWVTHRLPSVWENPEGFDPERFAPDKAAALPHFSYFPFGGGPRFCIGQNFALTEGTLALATLAQRFDVALVPGRRVQIANAVTLRPEGGLHVTLKRRTGGA